MLRFLGNYIARDCPTHLTTTDASDLAQSILFAPRTPPWSQAAREAHDWFLRMMRDHEEFEVETDKAGEWPMPFWSETVRQVVVE